MSIRILAEIAEERQRQDAQWGEQNHPDGTGYEQDKEALEDQRHRIAEAVRDGNLTWSHILLEEVAEAFAEHNPEQLRAELLQIAAVAVCWIEAIDRRTQNT